MPMNLSISLWNYIHYFPLRKGGTSFFLDGGLDSLARVIGNSHRRLWRRIMAPLVQLGMDQPGARSPGVAAF